MNIGETWKTNKSQMARTTKKYVSRKRTFISCL